MDTSPESNANSPGPNTVRMPVINKTVIPIVTIFDVPSGLATGICASEGRAPRLASVCEAGRGEAGSEPLEGTPRIIPEAQC